MGSDLRVSRHPPATVRRFFGPATVRSPQTDTRQPSSPHAGPLKRCPLTPPPFSPPQLGPGAPQAARPLIAPRTAAGPPPPPRTPRAAARGECQPGTRQALSGLRSRPLAPGLPAHLSWRQARPRRWVSDLLPSDRLSPAARLTCTGVAAAAGIPLAEPPAAE